MIPWYYALVALCLGLQIGDWICERRWRKEREAEFDRKMASLRDQAPRQRIAPCNHRWVPTSAGSFCDRCGAED